MTKIITLAELDRGWAVYKGLLAQHKADFDYLQQAFDTFYNKAYDTGGWSLTKSLFIDAKPLFWYWCEAAVKASNDFPDSNILFWKEYWTLTLIVMALMYADNMAKCACQKTNDPDWGFRFKIYDGRLDLLYITVNLVNTKTGAHAPQDGAEFYPSVRIYFPTYSSLKGFSEQEIKTGNFPIEFNPDVNIAEDEDAPSVADFGRELKKAVIAASNGNL